MTSTGQGNETMRAERHDGKGKCGAAPASARDLAQLHPLLISTGFLEKHPDACDRWWDQLLALSSWLCAGHHARDASLRERCWEVFGNEGACEDPALSQCVRDASGRELEDLLLVYEDVPEDLPFTVAPSASRPSRILVSENRDPYLAVRRGLLSGKTTLFGTKVDAVVYGRGAVARQFQGASLRMALESIHAADDARVLYWGDVDREGLSILATLSASVEAVPLTQAYEAMLDAARPHGPRPSPDERTLPMPHVGRLFPAELGARLLEIAQGGMLLPQEVLSSRVIGESMS